MQGDDVRRVRGWLGLFAPEEISAAFERVADAAKTVQDSMRRLELARIINDPEFVKNNTGQTIAFIQGELECLTPGVTTEQRELDKLFNSVGQL